MKVLTFCDPSAETSDKPLKENLKFETFVRYIYLYFSCVSFNEIFFVFWGFVWVFFFTVREREREREKH